MSNFPSETPWPDHAIVFEVWGDYGCFRRYYTTRSPLTFPLPPRPSLAGLIGCIAGIAKDEVANRLSDEQARLAVRLMAPVKTIRLGLNWLETKGQVLHTGLVEDRTQINVELLKDPRFRVYVQLKDRDLATQLKDLLQHHRSVYTPCLGVSELLADFGWVGEWPVNKLGPGVTVVHTALPADRVEWPDKGEGIRFEPRKHYDRKRFPRLLSTSRAVLEWQDLLIETSAKPILAHMREAWRVGDDHVVWL